MVYGLGKVGRLEGLVFPDFEVNTDWPNEYKWRAFGLDFGFTNDPSALIEVRYAHGNLYAKQLFYETGLTNPDIAKELQRLKIESSQKIIADSAEPKSIEELKRRGFNAVGAIKGKDSVNQGIDAMKRYSIIINAGSKDLIEEFSSYQWKEDKDGNSTNKPIDAYNHLLDSFRYCLSYKLMKDLRPKTKRRNHSHSYTRY
jgi:phage terminase large subunit